jgi:hypothetical protein
MGDDPMTAPADEARARAWLEANVHRPQFIDLASLLREVRAEALAEAVRICREVDAESDGVWSSASECRVRIEDFASTTTKEK